MTALKTLDDRGSWTSASNAYADSLCPGRHLAQAGLPDIVRDYAESGSRIHAALASGDASALSLAERETFDACKEIEAQKLKEFFGDAEVKSYREGGEFDRYYVRIPRSDNQQGFYEHSGKPDVVHRTANRALICEYKTLAGDVPESSKNLQLRDQQCLVRGKFMIQGEIGVVVIQPLVTRNPDICVYTVDDTMQATMEMFDRVRASNNPKSLRVAGEVQCKFCKAKLHCLEYQKWASAMVPALAKLEVAVADWTAEQCASFLMNEGVARQWLEETKDAIKSRVKADPNAVPGWTLKDGATREIITDAQECHARFLALGGTPEQFLKTVSVGKTALKEVLAQATGLKGIALVNKIKQLTDGIVERKQNAPSIVKVGEA